MIFKKASIKKATNEKRVVINAALTVVNKPSDAIKRKKPVIIISTILYHFIAP